MRSTYQTSDFKIYRAEALMWLEKQRANSFHAVVTDPPFSSLEYSSKELQKRRNGRGGIWRLPNAFDGAMRQPVPRFTVLDNHDLMAVFSFHLVLAPALFRVLVPGAHVLIASQSLIAHFVTEAFQRAGFEVRGQIVRIVKTLRGGDRPKFGHKEFADVSVIPRSCFEPWLIFRKPCNGRVVDNLRRFGTGALRRPARSTPLPDLLEVPPARSRERSIAKHPSLKPQYLMRWLVRASLPLKRGVILDPFMGSGSTLAAARAVGLKSVGVESDYKYFSMARSAIPKLSRLICAEPKASSRNGRNGTAKLRHKKSMHRSRARNFQR
jgi:DNA modification methylase